MRNFTISSNGSSCAPERPIRVVLADDECMFRACLRQLLSVPPRVIQDVYGVRVPHEFEVVGEAGSGRETVDLVHSLNPDLLLLDVSMPRMSGLEALSELAGCHAHLRTVLLASIIERRHLLTAVQLGVQGLVLKDSTAEVLFQAIVSVMAGQYWMGHTLVSDLVDIVRNVIRAPDGANEFGLTLREREVLGLVAAGYPNKEIARKVRVSHETVKHHLTRIYDKVGVSNRVELLMQAARHGLVDGC